MDWSTPKELKCAHTNIKLYNAIKCLPPEPPYPRPPCKRGSAKWAKPFELAAAAGPFADVLNELHVLTY